MKDGILTIISIIISLATASLVAWMNLSLECLKINPCYWSGGIRIISMIYIFMYTFLMLNAITEGMYRLEINNLIYVYIGIIIVTGLIYLFGLIYYLNINFINWSGISRHILSVLGLVFNIVSIFIVTDIINE